MSPLDISTAFLHAKLDTDDKPIHIRPPMEFYDDDSTIWKIKRAVYGLKTSPREWQEHFANIVSKKLGMKRSRIDANLYTKILGTDVIMLLVYVDDLFILGPDEAVKDLIEAPKRYKS